MARERLSKLKQGLLEFLDAIAPARAARTVWITRAELDDEHGEPGRFWVLVIEEHHDVGTSHEASKQGRGVGSTLFGAWTSAILDFAKAPLVSKRTLDPY